LAGAVTDRIWPCVMLQWEWLGGLPPLRRAAVIGAGSWGTSLAVLLARAGLEVELGCRTAAQVEDLDTHRVNERYLPGVALPDGVRIHRAADLALSGADLVCFAVPSRDLPAAAAAHAGDVPARAGVVVVSKGLVPPLGTLPSAYVSERVAARAVGAIGGPAHAADALERGASLVFASVDPGFARQLAHLFAGAGFDAHRTTDITGVELAGCAKNAAALAAAAAAPAGPTVAGAVAGKVFAEVGELARTRGARPETFAGLAGTGDLIATVLAQGSRNRRAGELIGGGMAAADVQPALGQSAEAVDAIPLLAGALRDAGVPAPTLDGLSAMVEGSVDPAQWSATITAPSPARKVRAA
jgi:glycerol-3-phosphate dehydrogenase